jgi:predicted nucleic acid-binding protein
MSRRLLVDTNVLLRFLTGEPKAQAERARNLFNSAAAGEVVLEVPPVVVAEVCYTLESFYRVDRRELVDTLAALLSRRGVKVLEEAVVFDALKRLKEFKVGFADAYLAASAGAEKIEVASFDRDFDRFKDLRRMEPR